MLNLFQVLCWQGLSWKRSFPVSTNGVPAFQEEFRVNSFGYPALSSIAGDSPTRLLHTGLRPHTVSRGCANDHRQPLTQKNGYARFPSVWFRTRAKSAEYI